MKSLILTDDTFERLFNVLEDSEDGRALIREFDARPQLPGDRELLRLSRDKNAEPPRAIALARDYRDAGRQAAVDTRERMEALLLHCYAVGVRPVTLGRWFGLRPTRVYEIFNRDEAARS
jgi:hypothetical protein